MSTSIAWASLGATDWFTVTEPTPVDVNQQWVSNVVFMSTPSDYGIVSYQVISDQWSNVTIDSFPKVSNVICSSDGGVADARLYSSIINAAIAPTQVSTQDFFSTYIQTLSQKTKGSLPSDSIQQSYTKRILSWQDELTEEIGKYINRAEGWDGYGAVTISQETITDAQQFIKLLPDNIIPPRDQPHSDGGISLIWREKQSFAEVGFTGNNKFYWYATNGAEEDSCDDVPIAQGLPISLQSIMGMCHFRKKPMTSVYPIYDKMIQSLLPQIINGAYAGA